MLTVAENSSMLVGLLLGILLILILSSFVYFQERKSNAKHSTDQTALLNRFKTTFIQCKETAFNRKVKNKLEWDVGDYQPPWWYSPHIGTLFAFGIDQQLKYESEIFEVDETRFTLDWYPNRPPTGANSKRAINVIVFLPGLGLTSRNKFAQNFATTVAAAGFYLVVVGSRGIDIPLKSSRFWHPGDHGDAAAVVDHIYETYHSPLSGGTNKSNSRGKTASQPKAPRLRIFITGYSAGSNITQQLILNTRHKKCAEAIRGAMCVCINYDYLSSRKNLEATFVGAIYSMLMTYALKDIIRKNSHVHDSLDGGSTHINRLLTSCTFMSDYDRIFGKYLHGYPSDGDMNAVLSMHDAHRIDIPLLAVQPSDDPLHIGRVRDNICLDKVTSNPNIVYLEPQHGNHFGFYEGPLSSAFTNTTSYTYPAKLAVSFFNAIIEHESDLSTVVSPRSS